MINLVNITKEYRSKSGMITKALDGISVAMPSKGMVFVLGKSGCGKSTLLNLLGGLDNATNGDVVINGKNLSKYSSKEMDSYRNENVGFIFQEFNLIDEYTIFENIAIALRLRGNKNVGRRVEEVLADVDLVGFEKRKTSELSGGQKQRVAIARALVGEVNIILADEPTGNLDSENAEEVFEMLKKVSENRLVIVVSHDRENAEKYADRIVEMSDGVKF